MTSNRPLISAAEFGHLDVVDLLLNKCGSVIPKEDVEFGLTFAVRAGRKAVVERMVREEGMDLRRQQASQEKVLMPWN